MIVILVPTMTPRQTKGMLGSANSREVLLSARHTLVETSPIAIEVTTRNNANIVNVFIISPPIKTRNALSLFVALCHVFDSRIRYNK
jgi:hypothetical protein